MKEPIEFFIDNYKLILFIVFIAAIGLCALPYWIKNQIRLGLGMRFREVYIIEPNENLTSALSVQKTIEDSGILKENNIVFITNAELTDEKLKGKTLLIFCYNAPSEPRKEEDRKKEPEENKKVREKQCALLDRVLDGKEKKAGLIVYARTEMPRSYFMKVGDTDNTVIVTAKGRLLNDLLNMMMTTEMQMTPSRFGLLGKFLKAKDVSG